MSYGSNIALTDDFDFDFSPDSKSLSIIANDDNLVQAIKIILNTFQGENKIVSNFGTRLQDLIGHKSSDNFIKYTVKNALLHDDRIASVDKIYVGRNKDRTVTLKITITTTDAETLELTGGLGWTKLA
jgi:phage baseplate assembly protein W